VSGRALVTGGTGFLGAHLATALEAAGHEVRVLDVHPPEDRGRREFIQADVRDGDAVHRAARGCTVVVDNAALVPVTRASAEEYRAVNVGGCRNTLAAAREAGAYLVHVSSSAIYGVPRELPVRPDSPLRPFEPYGASKAEAERAVDSERRSGLAVASLRPRTLLGEGRLGLFDVIFERIRAGRRVPVFGRGTNPLQLCHVDDFCAAVLRAVERRASGSYNIGAEAFGSVRSDLEGLIGHAGTGARVQPVPVWAIRAVLQPLDLIGRSPFSAWHWRSAPAPFYFDVSKAREELDWAPRYSNADTLVAAYEHHLAARTARGDSAHRRPLEGALARLLRG